MSQEKAVIIIPTYNEEENIANTIKMVLAATDSLDDYQVEVLVFDSNSTDSTAEIVQQMVANSSRVHFAKEPQKTGLGSAYLQAMHFAIDNLNADIVFEFDADGSHQPHYIAPMLELLKNHDVVVGSRYIPGGSIPSDWGINRKLLSIAGNWIARLLLTRKYKDLTSGLRATRATYLKKILPAKFLSNHYAYKLQLYWLLYQAKARIVEFPIVFIDREKGNSKLPRNSIIDTLRVLTTLRLAQLRQYLTMCFVGSFGALIQFIVYNCLRNEHYSAFVSSQIAISAAMLSNFTFNHFITFRRQSRGVPLNKSALINRLTQFILYSVSMVYFQSFLVYLGVHFLGTGTLIENLIVAASIYLGSIVNYLFYSNIIWPKNNAVLDP